MSTQIQKIILKKITLPTSQEMSGDPPHLLFGNGSHPPGSSSENHGKTMEDPPFIVDVIRVL